MFGFYNLIIRTINEGRIVGLWALLVLCLLFIQPTLTQADSNPYYQGNLIQVPVLAQPEAGSIAGDLKASQFESFSNAKGEFPYVLPLNFPKDRGDLLVSLQPTYAMSAGLSNWGMGFKLNLSIRRYREVGNIQYSEDDFLSPWGVLKKGTDGFWYPTGLQAKVKVHYDNKKDQWVATLPELVRLYFGGQESHSRTSTDRGTYAWYLVEAVSADGLKNQFKYLAPDEESHPILSTVEYGGKVEFPTNRIVYSYEQVDKPIFDYYSGRKLYLKARIQNIQIFSKHRKTLAFEPLFKYSFQFKDDKLSPRYFLERIQRVFTSGTTEPPLQLSYYYPKSNYQDLQWQNLPEYDWVIAQKGKYFYLPSNSTALDTEQQGVTEIEVGNSFDLIKKQEGQVTIDKLGPPPKKGFNFCRPSSNTRIYPPRKMTRFYGYHSDQQVFADFYNSDSRKTTFALCDREGVELTRSQLSTDWSTGKLTKLVDLNDNGKPDLIRYFGQGWIQIAENRSTPEDGIVFQARQPFQLPNIQGEPSAIWIQDLNGDGIPDLVIRFSSTIFVWYGKGNFEFESRPDVISLWESHGTGGQIGSRIEINRDFEFNFVDINQDGVTDLVVSDSHYAWLFLNQGVVRSQDGSADQRQMVLSKINYPLGELQENTFPLFLDLTGSGNPQIVLTSRKKLFAAEVAEAGTGLLKTINDGKGSALSFSYTRMMPEQGIGHRAPLVAHLEYKTSGKTPGILEWSYEGAKVNSASRRFLGYQKVSRVLGTIADPQIERMDQQFLLKEDSPPLILEMSKMNLRPDATDLITIERHQYDEQGTYLGVPYYPVISTQSGYSTGTSAHTQPHVEHQKAKTIHLDKSSLCPVSETTSYKSDQLIKSFTYSKVPGWPTQIHCLTESIQWEGIHNHNDDFDFRHKLIIARNDAGQPTEISLDPGSDFNFNFRSLQKLEYDDQYRIIQIQTPSEGTTRYQYGSEDLNTVILPSGKSISVQSRHPLSGASQTLENRSFNASQFIYSQFDDWNRPVKQWDTFDGVADQNNPSLQFEYKFADEDSLGQLRKRRRIDSSKGSLPVTDLSLYSGDGDLVAEGRQARSDENSFIFDRVLEKNSIAASVRSYAPSVFEIKRGNSITLESLVSRRPLLGEMKSFLDGLTQNIYSKTQDSVENHTVVRTSIEGGTLVQETLDALGKLDKRVVNLDGQLVTYVDDTLKSKIDYQYDSLGRIRTINLPEGKLHRFQYNHFGDIERVNRSETGSISYEYDPTSGLLIRKNFYTKADPNQPQVRHEWQYDIQGRKTSLKQSLFDSKGNLLETKNYQYYWDGKSPQGSARNDQNGFLGWIVGPGYRKNFLYRADGKLLTRALQINNQLSISDSFEYSDDKNLKSKTVEVQDGTFSTKIKYEYFLDESGRIASIRLNGKDWQNLHYSMMGALEQATVSSHGIFKFEIDPVTQLKRGWTYSKADNKYETNWTLNPRGSIAWERFKIGMSDQFQKNYEYFENDYLKSEQGPASRSYDYTVLGSIASETTSEFSRNYMNKEQEIRIESKEQGTLNYTFDTMGRIHRLEGKQFEYGSTGRVESIREQGIKFVTYLYDEEGVRLAKTRAGKLEEVYREKDVYRASALYEPVHLNGVLIGISKNGEFHPVFTDSRGSIVGEPTTSVANNFTAFGESLHDRSRWSFVADYVEQGFDPDLGAHRMAHRDYDSISKMFLTPDPLFLESPEACARAPRECNLYGYGAGNPIALVDPSGLSTHIANRGIGPLRDFVFNYNDSKSNPTHTFVFTTKIEHGVEKLDKTYSWGNDGKSWTTPNRTEDVAAASKALEHGLSRLVGSSSLDKYVDQAYKDLQAFDTHPWKISDTCKDGADRLIHSAQETKMNDHISIENVLNILNPDQNSSSMSLFGINR